MARIDPHTHSNVSDGTDTPTELMEAAARAGLTVVGLTDHDTTRGWEEAGAQVERTGVSLLRGMEVSCQGEGITVHLLSYLHDPTDPDLLAACAATLASRRTRAQRMVENLSGDYPITFEDVLRHAPATGPVGRPHIADALVEAGCFPDRNACFEWALHPRGPYYARHVTPSAVEAVQLVRAAGGVPIIAHPRARTRQRLLPVEILEQMVQAGLAGMECYHRDHSGEDVEIALRQAKEFGLLVTGSSDYHGHAKLNRLGENTTDVQTLACIREQGKLEVIEA